MLERLNIRGKLLAVVLVPVLVLGMAAAYIVVTSLGSYGASENAQKIVDAIGKAGPAITAVQAERDAAVNFLSVFQTTESKLQVARNATDTRWAEFKAAAPDIGVPENVIAGLTESLDVSQTGHVVSGFRDMQATPISPDTGFPTFPIASAISNLNTRYGAVSDIVATAAGNLPESADATQALRALSLALLNERDAAVRHLTAPAGYVNAYLDNASAVPAALAELESAVDSIPNTDANQLIIANFRQGLLLRNGLDEFRAGFTAGTASIQRVLGTYTEALTAFQVAIDASPSVVPDATLAAELQAYASLSMLIERMRYEEVVYTGVAERGSYISGELGQILAIGVRTDLALEEAQTSVAAVSGLGALPGFGASGSLVGDTIVSFDYLRGGVQSGLDERLDNAVQYDWSVEVQQEVDVIQPFKDRAWTRINDRSDSLVQSAAIRVIVTLAIVAAAIIGSLLIAQAIARRIINPLRRLTTTATAVRQELPRLVERVALPGRQVDVTEVQIPVESQDEVGRLAEAFNSVNAATLAIAAEQAALRGSISEMFINVARRDQVLLNRQLASIDEMERTQDDPETLTKLFALDHLATRMRRNSESLLVLAGIDTGRRLRRPMPLSDVIRTASSEIELYERVQLQLETDPAMLGHSALTAAHLFAELLENATVFSDPGTQVTVEITEEGNSYKVTVTDKGIGMTAEELAEANARVASTAASEILGAQRLGLFVVGRIARRVGARVYLESVEGQGTVATVVMPASLFDLSEPTDLDPNEASVTDEGVHAPSALVNRSDEERELDEAAGAVALGSGAYTPPVVVEGESLRGREPLVPTGAAADGEPDATIEPSGEVAKLIAEDAAAAPTVTEVNTADLIAGSTPVGLPTRRRNSKGPEAPKDTDSIIALPSRASDEQLSALQTAATSGFTPILAESEVSPERAEERSRVFRGFRPMRGSEPEPVEVAPDAESLGHAVRRGAADVPPVLGETSADEPATSDQEPSEVTVDSVGATDREEGDMGQFEFGRPVTGQSPLISAGFDPLQTFQQPDELSADLEVPLLEDDDEIVPTGVNVGPGPIQRTLPDSQPVVRPATPEPQLAHAVQGDPQQQAPVAPGHDAAPAQAEAWQDPNATQQQYGAWQGQPQPTAPFERSPLYPTATRTAFAPAAIPPVDAAPFAPVKAPAVTSSPSLDDLILEGTQASASRPGFFSKLFGRGGKDEVVPQGSVRREPVSPIVELAQSGGFAQLPANPQTSPNAIIPSGQVPMVDQHVQPATADFAGAFAPATPATFGPSGYVDASTPAEPGYGLPAAAPFGGGVGEGAPDAAIAQAGYGAYQDPGFAPSAYQEAGYADAGYVNPGYMDAGYADAVGQAQDVAYPASAFAPQADSGFGYPQDNLGNGFGEPLAPAYGAYGAPVSPFVGERTVPHVQDWEQYQEPHPAPTSGALFDSSTGTFYSPDQLARPLGWEAAGESALLASESQSYSPVVQIDPEPMVEAEADFTSMAFSELSSLAAERPKVERTRAGLVKRAAVSPSDQPVEATVAEATRVERDPNAVGRRFAAFYSGTRRARTDAEQYMGRAESR